MLHKLRWHTVIRFQKRSTSPPPPAQPCGGEGAEGCFPWNPEDLFNKNGSYTSIIIKSTLKMTFFLKTSEATNFFKIFCEAWCGSLLPRLQKCTVQYMLLRMVNVKRLGWPKSMFSYILYIISAPEIPSHILYLNSFTIHSYSTGTTVYCSVHRGLTSINKRIHVKPIW
jgi:hypothetical protein